MPRHPARTERVRLNLDVPISTRERIDKIQALSEADTMTEVIRKALIVYEYLLETDG